MEMVGRGKGAPVTWSWLLSNTASYSIIHFQLPKKYHECPVLASVKSRLEVSCCELHVRVQGRAQFEGLWRPGEVPEPEERPTIAVLLSNVQLVSGYVKWRPLPPVGGFYFNQATVPFRSET